VQVILNDWLLTFFCFRFSDRKPAVGAYAQILDPPVSVCDVTYWLNCLSETSERFRNKKFAVINTAGELLDLYCSRQMCDFAY
jgi:hypothetical protein